MPYITVQDGTQIYYKDWGNPTAQPVVFSHGWPLSADDWDNQMFFLASQGYRVIAHDRRGHGRSSQPWHGNDMDTYADDLHHLFEHLDLHHVMMVGHSTGGGEVARFLGRHGTSRVARAVLVSAVTPGLIKTAANPGGVPRETFDSFRTAMLQDRAQFFVDVPSGPFFGFNRPGAAVSQGKIWSWWLQGMQCGFNTTILHGTDDQVVPIDTSARRAIQCCKRGTIKEFPGAPHALPTICVDQVNQELLNFLKSGE